MRCPGSRVMCKMPHANASDMQGDEDQENASSEDLLPCEVSTPGIAIPNSRLPLPVPGVHIHSSSAPSDSRLARAPSRAYSPYTLHLAHHCRSQEHLPIPSPEEKRAEPVPVPRVLHSPSDAAPGTAHRGSGSSGVSCASPIGGSPAGGAQCWALMKNPSRGHSATRHTCIAMDASLESRRLLSPPEGLIRSSSGRSDALSSRGWSPGGLGGEWGAVHNRQRLLEHPHQVLVLERTF